MNFAKRLGISASLLLVCATALRAQVPVFTSPLISTGYVGVFYTYQISASNAVTLGRDSPLPAGLELLGSVIRGTPQVDALGTNKITLSATDGSSTSTTNLTLIIVLATPSPQILNSSFSTAIVGQYYTNKITVTNVIVTGYGAAPRPSWLSFDSSSGLLYGTPLETAPETLILLTASNATSVPGTKNLTINVLSASAANATNEICFEGFEDSFPSGWQVGDANASGTPAYWAAVSSPFGGVTAADGDRMAYCAGVGYAGGSATPKYQNNMAAFMQRTFDLSGSSTARLKFKSQIHGIEVGFDYCRVRISTDSGAKWTDVWNVSRVDDDWTPVPIELKNYAGKSSVTIRFEFDSDGSMNSIGWFLDDIQLLTGQGDRFDNASVFGLGTNHAGSVESQDLLDVSRVTLRKGYRYVLTATPGSLADPQMWLFDPTRAQLAHNDDDPQGGLGSRITYNCPATGEYYVQVGGVSGGIGSYTLLVTEQPAVADIAALSVGFTLPAGDPRGRNPASLNFSVLNNGPMDLNNDETYSYLFEVFLSTSRVNAGTGVQIGSETVDLSLSPGESIAVAGSTNAYTIPAGLAGGTNFVWLHITSLGGSPTDSISTNNWVVGDPVTIPPATNVTISGTVTKSGGLVGMPGVIVTLLADDGSTTNTVVADSSGNYSKTVTNGWSGTITPSVSGLDGAFSPPSRACIHVAADLASQNFAWAPALTISGRITSNKTTTGVAGIAVELSDGSDATVTDEDGNYSLTVSNGWSGAVTPTFDAGGFSPASRSYRKIKASISKNYVWIPPPKVSGSVIEKKTKAGKPGVTITFSGGAGSVVTDGSGNFSMTLPYNWTGSAAASYTGVTFSPASIKFSKLVKDKAKQKFTWTAPVAALALPVPAAAAASAGMPAAAPAAAAGQLLRTSGTVRWTGADAGLARQSRELLLVTLVNGEVRVEPKVPVVAPGELSLALEFVPGLAGIVGTADCELAVIRNVDGLAVAEPSLRNTRVVDAVLLRTSGNEAVLTWDLLLLETCRQKPPDGSVAFGLDPTPPPAAF